jgi:hypothetical protein
MTATEPWLVEGARVARVVRRPDRVEFVTVKRIGKLHVTIEESDEKFRVQTLGSIAPRGAWDPIPKLVAADDPEVATIQREAALSSARLRVNVTADKIREASRKGPQEERAAIGNLRKALDRLEALLTD